MIPQKGEHEEVWYRGLFLSRFTDLVGARSALAVTTRAFGGMHFMTGYTGNAGSLGMIIIALFLGLACGLIVQKTRTMWGAVLAHAAADSFYIFAYFAALP
jgi:membrane protease YdiL (CAAX protease family)